MLCMRRAQHCERPWRYEGTLYPDVSPQEDSLGSLFPMISTRTQKTIVYTPALRHLKTPIIYLTAKRCWCEAPSMDFVVWRH